ncbi:MAG: molybdopterin-dependent oxidoreductase [Ignavibacteriales bacterium]|nr:molybdopterin-dependent oxidoreductase [Ignavibacteriales bacterium]
MPKFVLDGNEIIFTPGQTIIQAAADAGIEIPHFCWHPSLSVSGNCRVCLVEVEKMPKLVIACSTLAAEGMVVSSQSEKTLAARNAVMEFILINHPLDCPICDEAGECKLQDYAYQHSTGESRFTETKQHKDKRVELGTHVMFDGERSISCSRCIRFCDEIAKESQLTFVKRGDKVTIVTFPGKSLDNAYSLNVTDICPVGALTNRDFRFQSRVWDMSSTKTLCAGCSNGCNIELWVRNNKAMRITPRQNDNVNSYWMCDTGRLDTFKHVNSESRVDGPHVRRNGSLTKVTWDEAFSAAVSELKGYTKDEIAYFGSAHATCEDNYMLVKLAKALNSTKNINCISYNQPGMGDNILIKEDKAPNTRGAELAGIQADSNKTLNSIVESVKAGKIKALYVMEDDIIERMPELEEVIAKLDFLVVHAVNYNKMTKYANIVFPAASYAEKHGTWINHSGRIQRIRPAVSVAEMDRSLDGLAMSRLDKFGTEFDRWGKAQKYDARPSWRIIVGMLKAHGHKIKFAMAEEVFTEMAENITVLKDVNYDVIGELGLQLKYTKTVSAKV